tara:strand:- start:290 stop:457 length:168 start_codon:yes stop_codon:yes gene_type:complete
MTRYEKTTHYIDSVIEGMDFKDMYRYIFDTMLYDLEHSATDEEIDELYNDYFNEQ